MSLDFARTNEVEMSKDMSVQKEGTSNVDKGDEGRVSMKYG